MFSSLLEDFMAALAARRELLFFSFAQMTTWVSLGL